MRVFSFIVWFGVGIRTAGLRYFCDSVFVTVCAFVGACCVLFVCFGVCCGLMLTDEVACVAVNGFCSSFCSNSVVWFVRLFAAIRLQHVNVFAA